MSADIYTDTHGRNDSEVMRFKINKYYEIHRTNEPGLYNIIDIGSVKNNLGRVYSTPIKVEVPFLLIGDSEGFRRAVEDITILNDGPIIGQYALIEDLEGNIIYYSTDTIEALLD